MKKFLLLLLIVFTFLSYEFSCFIRMIPGESEVSEDIAGVDAIIVLTGGQNRIKEGLRLQKKYAIKKLFISGVYDDTSLEQIFDSLDLKDAYTEQNIEIGHMARSTIGNRKEAEDWAQKNYIKNILLVTSNYHVPRSYLLFKSSKVIDSVKIYPSFGSKFTVEKIFKDRYSVNLIFSEFIKYLACKWSIFISDL